MHVRDETAGVMYQTSQQGAPQGALGKERDMTPFVLEATVG